MNCHLVFINVMTQQREVMQVSDLSHYLSSWIGFKIWMLDCPWRQAAAQEITSCKPAVVKQASCHILTIKREIFLTSKSKQESCVRITRTIKHFILFYLFNGLY
jgi:hypothetical protein